MLSISREMSQNVPTWPLGCQLETLSDHFPAQGRRFPYKADVIAYVWFLRMTIIQITRKLARFHFKTVQITKMLQAMFYKTGSAEH